MTTGHNLWWLVAVVGSLGHTIAVGDQQNRLVPKSSYSHSNRSFDSRSYAGGYTQNFAGRRRIIPHRRPRPRCTCGLSTKLLDGRIIGGQEAVINSYSWTAYLTINKSGALICGGALITDRHILTAAHCLKGRPPQSLWVTVGDHDRTTSKEACHVTVRVQNAFVHPQFTAKTFNYDVAVLQLSRPVLSNAIRPICLPSPRRTSYVGEEVVAAGWGQLFEYRPLFSNTLQEVAIKVVSASTCRQMKLEPYESPLMLTDTMLCAGIPEGGKDACWGDSGGPLMWRKGNRWYIVGIVSKGYGCAQPGKYGIYTKVSRVLEWIFKATYGGQYCCPY